MKTIGIMTIHTTYNYGAVLQAYATEAFFNNNGYDAELIDYTNPHIQEMLKLTYKQYGKWTGYIKTLILNTLFKRLYYYRKGFGKIHDTCRFSRKYDTRESLDEAEYDILVAGSDQLWNPMISGELDPVFFLQFGKANKRISVASSLGSYTLSDSEKKNVSKYLEKFDHISVREEFARVQLQQLTSCPIKVLLDPTLLLKKDFWLNKVIKESQYKKKTERYIVTYFAGGDKNPYRKTIAEYSKMMNLPVWTIQYSNYTWKESSKKILGATMEDFVALIANADLVITDSFHGVAFSLNMETNFVALTNTANPVRVRALLEKLELVDRIDMPITSYRSVDYTEVTPKLQALQKDSIDWIMNAVES